VLTFVSSVASDKEESILSAVQLRWVNLIMDTFAALALATDPPTRSVLRRQPDRKSAPLITANMWKMIVGHAIYQLAVTLTLNFAGRKILNYDHDREGQPKTLVFNAFVWMQIFNQYK
jgi:Ca2+-transporting ATPase